MAVEVKFLSLNVGMSATLAGLATILSVQKLDIIFLQEDWLTGEQLNLLVVSEFLAKITFFKYAVLIVFQCILSLYKFYMFDLANARVWLDSAQLVYAIRPGVYFNVSFVSFVGSLPYYYLFYCQCT